MGKYMRKAKLTGDVVAVMDVSQSSLGVRTRAKTLALQKLLASKATTTPPPEFSYLQLRSRRLEKPPLQQLTCCSQQNPNPSKTSSRLVISSGVCGSVPEQGQNQIKAGEETEGSCDFEAAEASFGENNIDLDGRERSTRESTPCSLIRDLDAISTPGSSTRPTNREASSRITQNSNRSMPLSQEIEEFFACHEQEQQRRFAEKYNFDILNEKPVEGRYKWIRVQPQ